MLRRPGQSAKTTGGRPSRRVVLAALAGLTTTALLSACSASLPTSSRTDRGPANRSAAVTAVVGPTPSPAPSATTPVVRSSPAGVKPVPRDRTFVSAGVGGEAFEQFTDVEMQNPFLPGISRSGFQVVMEPLFFYNPYHTASVCGPASVAQCNRGEIPWLAVTYAYNDDYTSVVVDLREGVLWSDGQPFTARDVVFTVNMLRENAPDLTWSIDMHQWVNQATALDDYTVQFALNRPNPRFIFDYFMFHEDFGIPIVPEHVFRGKDPRVFPNFDLTLGWPVVTGPYRLVYSDAHQKIWDRRDDWWGALAGFHALPEPERLVFLPAFPATTMADLIVRDQVDTTLNLSLGGIQSVLNRNPKITTWTNSQAPYGYVDYWVTGLGFNDMTAPFDDPTIRWAIDHVVNRDELVAVGYDGAGESALLPYPDFPALQPYLFQVSDVVKASQPGAFDQSKSAQIMRAKGYEQDRQGFWSIGGKRLSIPIVTFQVEQDITAVLVDQLRRGGFDATYTLPADYETPIYTGEAAAYVFGHNGSVRDPYLTLRLYESRFSAPTGHRATRSYRWRDPQFDQIVDQMGTIPATAPGFTALWRQALSIWLKALPDIPLVQFYHRIPVNTTYWTGWPDATNPYINTANWHRTFELVILSLKQA
ncbi:MAG TPA: ABC transporter substrate-binding protein [Chloroflexota bacterium]|nr:ABC transporter substrate-binding protein [Chloroflexota bacterium]